MVRTDIFDKQKMMRRLGGDQDLADEVMAVFLQVTPKHLAELDAALSAGDLPLARRMAHSVKGAAANVDAGMMREAALAVELAAGSGDLERSSELAGELRRRFDELKDALSAMGCAY